MFSGLFKSLKYCSLTSKRHDLNMAMFCRLLSQNIDKPAFLFHFFSAHSFIDMLLALEKQLVGMHINLVITF